jgi:hypothetical protein
MSDAVHDISAQVGDIPAQDPAYRPAHLYTLLTCTGALVDSRAPFICDT